ncbi:MAG: SDR family NAD(P)-dependent oxidoreductase, partial [Methylococcales bacterium]|nr:SDR family NAD(P)-dependent oxidoreductase [Methylococcales bacterium]
MSKGISFVTGASKGVGRGIAYGMAEDGWDVAINYFGDLAGAEETAEKVREMGQRALVVPGNVGDGTDVAKMFGMIGDEFGRLDCLVNNAGIAHVGNITNTSEEDFDRVMSVNLKG